MSDDEFQEKEAFKADDFWQPGVEAINGIDVWHCVVYMQGLTTCLQLTKTIEADEVFWVEYPEDGILAFTQRYV